MSLPQTAGVVLAQAPPPANPTAALLVQMVPLVLVFVIMYLLLIRPQQKKAKEHRDMISRLQAGDRVVTNGGIFGVVTAVAEDAVTLRVADNVEIRFVRSAVASVLGKEGSDSRRA